LEISSKSDIFFGKRSKSLRFEICQEEEPVSFRREATLPIKSFFRFQCFSLAGGFESGFPKRDFLILLTNWGANSYSLGFAVETSLSGKSAPKSIQRMTQIVVLFENGVSSPLKLVHHF